MTTRSLATMVADSLRDEAKKWAFDAGAETHSGRSTTRLSLSFQLVALAGFVEAAHEAADADEGDALCAPIFIRYETALSILAATLGVGEKK